MYLFATFAKTIVAHGFSGNQACRKGNGHKEAKVGFAGLQAARRHARTAHVCMSGQQQIWSGAVKPEELKKLDAYFKRVFGNNLLEVRARPKKDNSCELYKADEFLGVIYRDEDDGDYNFSMAILDIDLEE